MRLRLGAWAGAVTLVALCVTVDVHAANADEAIRKMAIRSGQVEPVVRIGLDDTHRVTVSADGRYRILDAAGGKKVWRDTFEGEIRVVAEGGPQDGAPTIFRVQVGAFTDRKAAERERDRLRRQVEADGVIHHDPDRGNWRVRMGRAEDRQALAPLMDRLRAAGIQGLWIAEEPAEQVKDVRLRLVDASYRSQSVKATRLVVAAVDGGAVRVGDRRYRGLVELRVSPYGTVRPVNWIGVETYLRGVVPAELGPEVWPELEALKAQAVAARTYVWRNRGQFSDEGFDLCATPRCQVYAGANAEHPLSDRAVAATSGQVLVSEGQPVVALYTATCGGHTEDGAEIFPEHSESYLKGVPCRAEGDALATHRGTVQGQAPRPIVDETGTDVTRDWALLEAAGVLDAGEVASDPVLYGDLARWSERLLRLAGRPAGEAASRDVATLGRAAEVLVALTGWGERARVLLADPDLPALLRDDEALALPVEQQRALAYLASVEGLRPYPEGRLGVGEAPRKARVAPMLVRIGDAYDAFGLRDGVVAGVGETSLRLVRGKGRVRLELQRPLALFGWTGGAATPASRLELWPGDPIRYRTGDAGIDFLQLLPPVKGTSDDRTSRVYSWSVRKSRREIEQSVNRRVSIGRLEDLKVARRGVSGRVVELEVRGTGATTTVRGFDVRRLLDLRESLAVIEIQRDQAGSIDAVVFAGKGWGHGVGLCQVGAYGMALRGADYRQILEHYYTGVRIVGDYGPGPARASTR